MGRMARQHPMPGGPGPGSMYPGRAMMGGINPSIMPGGPGGAIPGQWPGHSMMQYGRQTGSGSVMNMMPGGITMHNNSMSGQWPGYRPAMMQAGHQNLMMYGSGMGMLTTPDQDVYIFIESCKVNNVIKAKMALDLGVDVNAVSKDGHWSGITAAAYNNSKDIMELLLSHPDINVNVPTSGGLTINPFNKAGISKV